MKFSLIAATALLLVTSSASATEQGHGHHHKTVPVHVPAVNNSNTNTNTLSPQGGAGGQGGYSSAAGGNSSTSSRNKINNSSSSHSYYERETPVAPLLTTSDSATMEGVTVPLPTIGISGFYSNGDNSWNNENRDDAGVTLGLRLPLGGGQFRDAALRREKFQIVKEAIFLNEKGVLTYTAFPEHYIALYGAAPSPTDRAIK